jgi:hypothetical protein
MADRPVPKRTSVLAPQLTSTTNAARGGPVSESHRLLKALRMPSVWTPQIGGGLQSPQSAAAAAAARERAGSCAAAMAPPSLYVPPVAVILKVRDTFALSCALTCYPYTSSHRLSGTNGAVVRRSPTPLVSVNCPFGNVERRVTGSSINSPSSLSSVRRLLEGRRAKGLAEEFPGPLNSTHIPRVRLFSFASPYSCLGRKSNSQAGASNSDVASDRTCEAVAVFTFDRRPQLPLPVVSCTHRSARGANTTLRLSI